MLCKANAAGTKRKGGQNHIGRDFSKPFFHFYETILVSKEMRKKSVSEIQKEGAYFPAPQLKPSVFPLSAPHRNVNVIRNIDSIRFVKILSRKIQ